MVARPHLHAKEAAIANDRSLLDAKVKAVLVHPPTKFTEWLIQQGLVRSEQFCTLHPLNKLNLGKWRNQIETRKIYLKKKTIVLRPVYLKLQIEKKIEMYTIYR